MQTQGAFPHFEIQIQIQMRIVIAAVVAVVVSIIGMPTAGKFSTLSRDSHIAAFILDQVTGSYSYELQLLLLLSLPH